MSDVSIGLKEEDVIDCINKMQDIMIKKVDRDGVIESKELIQSTRKCIKAYVEIYKLDEEILEHFEQIVKILRHD